MYTVPLHTDDSTTSSVCCVTHGVGLGLSVNLELESPVVKRRMERPNCSSADTPRPILEEGEVPMTGTARTSRHPAS
eukprot:5529692-Prymnesium_polylepis.2